MLSYQAREYANKDEWLRIKKATPVRIQWDPERDLYLKPLEYRAIQIGLTNEAVTLFVNEWIQNITDVTDLAVEIHRLVELNQIDEAVRILPIEKAYPINSKIKKHLGAV